MAEIFNKQKQTETMNDNYQVLVNILSDWNTSAKQKGDACVKMAKELGQNGQVGDLFEKCITKAIDCFERSDDDSCKCDLAQSYFTLATLYHHSNRKVKAREYYLRSIEKHIEGSRDHIYYDFEFYKFLSVNKDTVESILHTIMLSSPSKFNDPVDCPIAQDKNAKEIFPDQSVFDGLKVCCFGEVDYTKENPMPFFLDSKKWAYYGDMHKGICIRYCFFPNDLEKTLSNKFVFKKVEYKQQFSFERGIVSDGLLSKSDQYKEENEWRIVWFDRNNGNEDESLFVPISVNNIISIHLGYRCPETIKDKVIEFAKTKELPLYVYKVHPDPKNLFKMVRTQIYPTSLEDYQQF